MTRVNIGSIWGSSPTFLADPGGAKVGTGWVNEAAIADWMNWWQNRADNALEEIERRGVQIYSAGTAYHKGGLAMGSDDGLYAAEIINPGVDPVGAAAGKWHLIHGELPYIRTVFNVGDDDPTWAPVNGAHKVKFTVTGAGGAGGGTPVAGGGTAGSVAGAGGGTGIHVYDHSNGTTYNIVIGSRGLGVSSGAGNAGANSSVTNGVTTVIGLGGAGGHLASLGLTLPGVAGGTATGADQPVRGGHSSPGGDGTTGEFSYSGGCIWGGGIPSTVTGSGGIDAGADQPGVGGGAIGGATNQQAGGHGGNGIVIAEEYFG